MMHICHLFIILWLWCNDVFGWTGTQICNNASIRNSRSICSRRRRRRQQQQKQHPRICTAYSTKSDTNDSSIPSVSNLVEGDSITEAANQKIERDIVSPVLRQVFPDLLHYVKQYGHPNIPLGSEAGRHCATLRRLRVQDKLVEGDVALLDSMNFIWHSLEDVYTKQKEYFTDFMTRLQTYQIENDGDISPPKKYSKDPELGAWVTALRRLYTVDEVDAEHVVALNELGFQWNSPRKCGSKFMQQYRMIQEQMESMMVSGKSDEEIQQHRLAILNAPDMKGWIQAQQTANLSETRKHYMAQLVGDDWVNFGR